MVQAGNSPAAQALLGKTVAMIGGAMYAQYRCMPASQCLPLPADASATDGASCFVNPLTALGVVETMKREGHQRWCTPRRRRTWGRCSTASA